MQAGKVRRLIPANKRAVEVMGCIVAKVKHAGVKVLSPSSDFPF